ncbi:MAG: hypothetical protein JSW14_00250 [Candidatus Bathyarchaeum sp.]|nr:MAG: hypothetical protein JSW14_00250 [Candidatus Bathyarchaeum sp.]
MPEESVIVVCPNPRCSREIEEPILLTNLSVSPAEQYDACPHCFIKLEPKTPVRQEEIVEKPVSTPPKQAVLEEAKESGSQVLRKVEDLILDSNRLQEKERKTSDCPQDFGYLANRPKDAPIPQECLFCPKMVDCMLKAGK